MLRPIPRRTRFSVCIPCCHHLLSLILCLLTFVYSCIVDGNGQVHLYDLAQQAALTSPGLWNTFTALTSPLHQYKKRISFFSATPRGGGVALMRHALIRVWRAQGLDVGWY